MHDAAITNTTGSTEELKSVLYKTEADDMKHAYRAMGMGVALAASRRGRVSKTTLYAVIDMLAVHYLFDKDIVKSEASKYGDFISSKTTTSTYTVAGIFGIRPWYTEHDLDEVEEHIQLYRVGIKSSMAVALETIKRINS